MEARAVDQFERSKSADFMRSRQHTRLFVEIELRGIAPRGRCPCRSSLARTRTIDERFCSSISGSGSRGSSTTWRMPSRPRRNTSRKCVVEGEASSKSAHACARVSSPKSFVVRACSRVGAVPHARARAALPPGSSRSMQQEHQRFMVEAQCDVAHRGFRRLQGRRLLGLTGTSRASAPRSRR